MRWRKKFHRYVKRFALFPICIGDETRWLEVVYIKQKRNTEDFLDWWDNIAFVDKGIYETMRGL